MQIIAGMLFLIACSGFVHATNPVLEPECLLDKVVFQLSAKQWVNTKTAMLSISVNATLSNANMVKARTDIMTNLSKIAEGEWHLTQFDRSQDNSGLEKLYVAAQARVIQANLTDIYKNAKAVSKPGATYEINTIEFKPSLEEVQQVKVELRERLYQQVKMELDRLNKVYAGQHYSLNRLFFIEGDVGALQPRAYNAKEVSSMAMIAAAAPVTPTVSNELVMNVLVEVASTRPGGNAVAG